MVRLILFVFLTFPFITIEAGNGRMPCDRGAGGIARCEGVKFICKDGRVSKSKKICSPIFIEQNQINTNKK